MVVRVWSKLVVLLGVFSHTLLRPVVSVFNVKFV